MVQTPSVRLESISWTLMIAGCVGQACLGWVDTDMYRSVSYVLMFNGKMIA